MIPKAFYQKYMPAVTEQSKITQLYYFNFVSFLWKNTLKKLMLKVVNATFQY